MTKELHLVQKYLFDEMLEENKEENSIVHE